MALLVYADADGVERQITVGPEPITVGRAEQCVIRSSDPRVSRNHARFFVDQHDTLYVEDLGSSNGVWVGHNKVQTSAVSLHENVLVGCLVFRLIPPPAAEPALQQVAWNNPGTQPEAPPWEQPRQGAPLGAPGYPQQYGAPAMPPPPMAPPPMAPPPPQMDTAALDAERKARKSAEEERDAYGARMAELHGEVRTLKAQAESAIATLEATKAQMARMSVNVDAQELEAARDRANEAEDRAKAAEARLRSAEEELQVARDDLMKAEDRATAAVRQHEEVAGAELKARVEELDVTRADLVKAEERILDLSRTVSDLEAKVHQLEATLSGRID